MEPVDFVEPSISVESSQNNRPNPTDFDIFLPWACREFSLDNDVVVIRAAQRIHAEGSRVGLANSPAVFPTRPTTVLCGICALGRNHTYTQGSALVFASTYVSAAIRNKKSMQKTKPLKSVATIDVGSDEDVHNSIIEKFAAIVPDDRVTIESVYDNNEKLVQLKFLKNKVIPRKIMKIIALTIPYQKYLNSIIIKSGLCMESLYEISKFLPNSNITEIILDSTYLSQANYHILLTVSNLKHLSLAKCTINDGIVKTIADQLKDPGPASRVLCALNLSSNRITDVGAKYLADMLRTNRQLCYLNLAGNMITDEGGLRIIDTLNEFPLEAQELLDSRAKYVAYLKQKNDLINTFIIELQRAKFDKCPKRTKVTKKGKLENQSLQHISLERAFVETGADAQTIQEKATVLADRKLGLYNGPFSRNNTKTQNGVVYCFGNNTLCYLNVAYNNLTYTSLKKLHEVIYTQMSLNRFPRGLIKVVIEGNLMPVSCKEFAGIDFILNGYRSKSEAAIKKKPLSVKSSSK